MKLGSRHRARIEDRIANAIQWTLEPYIVSLLAAVLIRRIEPDSLDRLDHNCDAELIDRAVSVALRLLPASREGIGLSRETRADWESEKKKSAQGEWLLCDSKANDDSFRRYLTEAGAPEFILKRGFKAHRNALLRHKLLFNAGGKDGKAVISLRPAYADKYIKAEREAKAKAAKRRRDKDA